MHKVFVYGTLKSGGSVRGIDGMQGASIVGKTKTTYPDYQMMDLGAFPGVFLKGDKFIEGEVWEVTDQVLENLDAIEGYPDFYKKQMIQTDLGKAIMYYLDGQFKSIDAQGSDNIEEFDDTQRWLIS